MEEFKVMTLSRILKDKREQGTSATLENVETGKLKLWTLEVSGNM